MSYTLFIGNKAYSSWSLRGWLLLKAFGLPFQERLTPMFTEAFEAMRADMAPGRTVPTLLSEADGKRVMVWDTLAIAEYLAERHPQAGHWPADPAARARARCLCAEMHSSFQALRSNMPMNMKRRYPDRGRGAGVAQDIARMQALWSGARGEFGAGGPYLFGAGFTAADAFFAPVASRFETYAVSLEPQAQAYAEALLAHPAVAEWRAAAQAEPWVEPRYQFEG